MVETNDAERLAQLRKEKTEVLLREKQIDIKVGQYQEHEPDELENV